MSKKMGRPPLPKGKARSILLAARFSGKEHERIQKAIRKSGKTQPEWIRNALLNAASR